MKPRKLMFFFTILALIGALQAFVPKNAISSEDKDQVLAQVGPYKLTVGAFEKQVKSLPPQFQMAIASNKQFRDSFLERWVEITLMALKAKEINLDKDPEVQARLEDLKNALLAQEFSKRFIEDKVKITDKEVKDYYDKHKDDYKQKEQVQARHILIKVPAGADEKAWEKAKGKALKREKTLVHLQRNSQTILGPKTVEESLDTSAREGWCQNSKRPPLRSSLERSVTL